jgi:hypothetical protein
MHSFSIIRNSFYNTKCTKHNQNVYAVLHVAQKNRVYSIHFDFLSIKAVCSIQIKDCLDDSTII